MTVGILTSMVSSTDPELEPLKALLHFRRSSNPKQNGKLQAQQSRKRAKAQQPRHRAGAAFYAVWTVTVMLFEEYYTGCDQCHAKASYRSLKSALPKCLDVPTRFELKYFRDCCFFREVFDPNCGLFCSRQA
jgi:hypothetical protein